MNYPESQQILEEIKKANKILVNCHRSPDPDSVASAISIYQVLRSLDKTDVTIISPDEIPNNTKFLPYSDKIKKVDFETFNFDDYELFIIVDTGNWSQLTGREKVSTSKIKKVIIDHHFTNPAFGDLNLIKQNTGSTCGLLYNLFVDWEVKLNPELATTLLTGIVADTMSFRTDIVGMDIFKIVDNLVEAGADRRKVLFNLYMTRHIDEIHLMGEMLVNAEIDKENRFAWVAIPKENTSRHPESHDAKSYVAGTFMQSVAGTDFGFVLEEFEGYCSVSFRSRTDFDVSKIAEELGGGGHKSASAVRLVNIKFDQAVEKVLAAARKYAAKS